MRRRLLRAEEEAWLAASYPTMHPAELAQSFDERFGRSLSPKQLREAACRLGARKDPAYKRTVDLGCKYTTEQDEWILANSFGRPRNELCRDFNLRFGEHRTARALSQHARKIGADAGVNTGRFRKGRQSENKSKAWSDFMSEDAQARARRGWYQPGQAPHNMRALLDERISRCGYREIKVNYFRRHKPNDQWISMARFVYEREHGPQPEGMRYVHINGDILDDRAENIAQVPCDLLALVNGPNTCEWDSRETLAIAIAQARVIRAARRCEDEAKMARKESRDDGKSVANCRAGEGRPKR